MLGFTERIRIQDNARRRRFPFSRPQGRWQRINSSLSLERGAELSGFAWFVLCSNLVQCTAKRGVVQHSTLPYGISGTRREYFPLKVAMTTILWVKGDANSPVLSPESCGGPAAYPAGVFPYVDVCLADNVLDLVDPRLQFLIAEYGRGIVRRGCKVMV
jgi:hypothetical protein